MCNRARNKAEPETLHQRFLVKWWTERPMDNRFNPVELYPKSRAYIVREHEGRRGLDIMSWDITAGQAPWPMTNVRNLALPQWKRIAANPANRCLVPLTEFAEWTSDKHQIGEGKPIKGEMWFSVIDISSFSVAGLWQEIAGHRYFAMVTCDPNELVAPIHPKAMVTILHREDEERWLTGGLDDVTALQQPYPATQMTVRGPVFPTRSASSIETPK